MRTVLIALLALFLSVDAFAAPRTTRKSPTEIYEHGLRMMRRGLYTRALEDFNRVRNYHRDDPISVKAQLAIADVYFKKGDYEQARFAYEEFATYHPRHENLDYVTWRIGYSIYKRAPKLAGRDQSSTKGAVNVWTGFDTRFPGSSHEQEVDKLLGRARNRLASKELHIARFYRGRHAWGAVEGRTRLLIRRYPESAQVPAALMWLGRARHEWGDVEGAKEARERLAEAHPESRELGRLDRWLAREPGEKPKEEVFIRPYRVRGLAQPGGQGI
ncbi:MAG: outer membrane protein assembly factor BamD [Myxococcota bacterium]